MYKISLLLCMAMLVACNDGDKKSFMGVLEYTAQAKDISSLCYSYSFKRSGTSEVFGVNVGETKSEVLDRLLGKPVTITGKFNSPYRRQFNDIEQRPINFDGMPKDIECSFFIIQSISLIK